jgi:hypothetical protein
VAVAVAGEEHRLDPGELAEQERRRRLPVRRADHFAVSDLQVDNA